jgi:hypothetical protein
MTIYTFYRQPSKHELGDVFFKTLKLYPTSRGYKWGVKVSGRRSNREEEVFNFDNVDEMMRENDHQKNLVVEKTSHDRNIRALDQQRAWNDEQYRTFQKNLDDASDDEYRQHESRVKYYRREVKISDGGRPKPMGGRPTQGGGRPERLPYRHTAPHVAESESEVEEASGKAHDSGSEEMPQPAPDPSRSLEVEAKLRQAVEFLRSYGIYVQETGQRELNPNAMCDID